MANKMKLLEGKVAIITGASRGIGKAITEVFANHGCDIAFSYSSSTALGETLEKELSSKVKIKSFQSDATDFEASQNFVKDVIKEFGKVDILINNVGITRDNLLLRMDKEDWQKVLQVNLDSTFNLAKAALKPMLKQRNGSIINMSSIVGRKGNAGQTNYAASKAGLIGFSKSLALELGSRNIRCNVVAPGFVKTDMTAELSDKVVKEWLKKIPLRRAALPEDIANTCLFLASDLSSYITGQTLSVDGGMYT